MEKYKISDIATLCEGELYNCNADNYIDKIVINDKIVANNCIFAAIKGERFDGNAFAEAAVKKGASLILSEAEPIAALPWLKVKNVREALTEIACFIRKRELSKVIAVTGSVGKTTVKEMIASVLSTEIKVLKTEGNQNNELGLALSVFAHKGEGTAVLEMGISEIGEMDRLSYVSRPDIAIITGIGSMHGEELKSREITAREKLKCLNYASKSCVCIVPYGEALLEKVNNKITVGVSKEADVYAENVKIDGRGSSFDAVFGNGERINGIFLPLIGMHAVTDALFSVAAASLMKVSKENILKGLSQYKAPPLRQNIIEENGVTVLLDCYNSGPESLMAALETFMLICRERAFKRRVLILGGMLELGKNSENEHIRLGKAAAEYGIFDLITYGDEARNIALGALIGGNENVKCFQDEDMLVRELDGTDFDGCAVLIKGSRAFKMERLLEYVTKKRR